MKLRFTVLFRNEPYDLMFYSIFCHPFNHRPSVLFHSAYGRYITLNEQ